MKSCLTCDKELTGKQRKFCSSRCKNSDHQNYQTQQDRGITRKKILVENAGGKCQECGYDKNLAALCFHHTNPSIKTLDITMRACSNNSMETLLEEATKCVILCANCHMEKHHPNYGNWK